MLSLCALLAALVLPFGGLYLTSLPSGADAWVDGTYVGRTPLFIDGLRAGTHDLTITKTGWSVEQLDEEIAAGMTMPLNVQLRAVDPERRDGTIAIHGLDGPATIAIDGAKPRALVGKVRVIAGVHRLQIRDAEAAFDRSVTVYPEQVTHVLLHVAARERSGVVAPMAAYLPRSAASISGDRLLIRWQHHLVQGRLGDARFLVDGREVVYDAPAGLVRGRLYLPLDLILTLTGNGTK